MHNDLVSIIIPVYNVEAYLDRCLISVCNQTHANIEILLLNDGSGDTSYDICQKWAQKDARIKLFTDINRGVSAVRNRGLQESSGAYVTFVDSDDVISEHYVEILLTALQETDADMAAITLTNFMEDQQPTFSISEDTLLIDDNMEGVFFERTSGTAGGKMYKSRILQQNAVRFNESIAVTEDLLFNLDYLRHCRKLAFNPSALYGYFHRRNSAVQNNVSPRWFTCLTVYKHLFEVYESKKVFHHIVYFYLKNLYESKYLLKTKAKNVSLDINVNEEIKRAEAKRGVLSFKQKAKLAVCKYSMGLVLLKRSKRSRQK